MGELRNRYHVSLAVGEKRTSKLHAKRFESPKSSLEKSSFLSQFLVASWRFWHFDGDTTFDAARVFMRKFCMRG